MWLIEQVPPAIGWSRAPSRLEVRQKSPRIALFVGWLMLFFSAAKVQVSRCRAGSVLVAACHSPCEARSAWAVSLPTVQGNSAGPQKAASAHPHGLAAASAPECLATQHCRHARSHRQPSDWPGGSGRQCLFRAHRASAPFSSCCADGTAPARASCAQ